ncbi:MAG: toxin-antitoxin system, antitoxin component, ribbon-helix-helix domain protein [Sulfurovum sp. FS08-3]|nr:MAG: toxin-antitoxin system, antitoxin component, ribbon-helix-helix domain protein [Sulfurovum sp. FS08-3]
MREEYDFSKSIPNPYVTQKKRQISIDIEVETIDYFKALSNKMGIPYQNLINSYLNNCATKKIEPTLQWGA